MSQDEVMEGFDAIFGWVPQATDENGKELSLADKIEILGRERDDLLKALQTIRELAGVAINKANS